MPRTSRGCLRCRERRVKCDETRPVCRRCAGRGDVCVGYRDETDLIFRHQTDKVVAKARGQRMPQPKSPPQSESPDPESVSGTSGSGRSLRRSASLNSLSQHSSSATSPFSEQWWNFQADELDPPARDFEQQAVSDFFEKYVMYPGRNSQSGFLEYLPCLFEQVNVDGRSALRSAVQAAALADASRKCSPGSDLAGQALECYGKSLADLSASLSEKGKIPDDYDLMTVVVLDLFETLFLPDTTRRGAHIPGIAHILRLQGEQFSSPRGWSVFRLAHHQMQKQQLAFGLDLTRNSDRMLNQLSADLDSVHLEKDVHQISSICERARKLLQDMKETEKSVQEVVDLVREMQALDRKAVSWRQGARWAFKTLQRDQLIGSSHVPAGFTDTIEIHPDVWSAYEWNYHRTARIRLHEQLITCLRGASTASAHLEHSDAAVVMPFVVESVGVIRSLADKVLATVPQTLGDVDDCGRVRDANTPPPKCRAVGAYLLLWSMRTIKSTQGSASDEQKAAAQEVLDRIRDYTGAKLLLGELSNI